MYKKISDSIVFIISAVIVSAIVAWGFFAPEHLDTYSGNAMAYMIESFGWFYVSATALFILFCLFLGFGPYRHMKLGTKEEKPEYTYFTWLGMLFAAGMGVGLVFWGVGEPLSHFHSPVNGAEQGTQEAAEEGLLYGVFHWGVHPWAVYAIVALGLAFAKFRKNLPGLVSSAFYPLIGDGIYKWPGKTIDTIVIIATTVGIATSFGMSTMQVGSGLSQLFNLETTITMYMVIIVAVTVVFLFSVMSGLNKGMRYLSISNLGLAGVLLLVAIAVGPTVFVFEHIILTAGQYVTQLPSLSFDTTPYTDNEWMGEWTLFYWAWVISWSPFVGTFIARVSRGRTLQEFIIGVLFVPTLITIVWFVTFGGAGIYFDMHAGTDIASVVSDTPEAGLFLVLEQFPFDLILSLAALVLISIFFITSANSATYVLGVFSSSGNLDPNKKVLLVWGLLISSIAAVLLASGGLDGMQAVATIIAFPFTILMLLMMLAVYKSLHKEGIEKHQIEEKEDW
ncbi:BCCT family transporter [Salisediminibacterium selenitireducens]|uniref:Choline/carnitine/betaine transporter n=1 Tax=Bacillus selenitireducens (strain ATCC 700615 / DSM 15326 / MLS10) TaxID=439292 RepID=D6XTE6_BACIE|nr:BCCT family transporter [Salisediminibacterium selenitireducens]ADH99082.1 choline/carnitine/betaine transporter [[Bacillus] selenitireducens MLS10]